ncbi:MAG: radical SAM protein, partial [Erysipelotrichaceae bacterium]
MNKPTSLYLHVPFCDQICSYCDFFRCVTHPKLVDAWLSQIEIDLATGHNTQLKTLYLGGGTPSALSPSQLTRLLQALQPYTKQLEEFSVEANPESLTSEKLALLAAYGVDRISLGVQSFKPSLQQLIHRSQNIDIKAMIAQIHAAGIDRISID